MKGVVAIWGVLLALACGDPPAEPPRVPINVVLVTIDALRADAVGYAGYSRDTTPELDRLVERAVAFELAVTSFQGTTPSMPSLMSGRFPSFEGVDEWSQTTNSGFSDLRALGEPSGYPHNLRMLAEVLSERKYATAGFTTNPHLWSVLGFDQGFQHYDEFETQLYETSRVREHSLEALYPEAEVVVDHALEWLDAQGEEPFFLWTHFMDVHSPYLPPPPFDQIFAADEHAEVSGIRINEALYRLHFDQIGYVHDGTYASFDELGMDQRAFAERLRELYDGSLRYVDAQIGRLLRQLEERGVLDHTLVIVTSDHGEEFFDHGEVIHHRANPAYEELLRIPLIVFGPGALGIPGGRRVSNLVRMVDIVPTLLDLVGHADATPPETDGVSLRPLLEGGSLEPLTHFVSAIEFQVVRTRDWKYRRTRGDVPVERLFAIRNDPLEATDLASTHPQVVDDLRARLDAFERAMRERGERLVQLPPARKLDPDLRRRLEALGYVGEE